MGLCGSKSALTPEEAEKLKNEKLRTKQIERELETDNAHDRLVNKLLLLGAGESGKSTLFKQMLLIYGDKSGFSEKDRKGYKPIIFNNVLTSIKALIEQGERLYDEQKVGEDTRPSASLQQYRDHIMEMKHDEDITPSIAAEIKALWADPGVQNAYHNRSRFQLTDSAAYFFSKLDEISASDYLPNEQDVLRSRVRTTGIVESEFTIDGNKFRMFDVGGQRNERKKWIHCFSEVTAVLFVAAMSEYDMVLYEDETTNRMEEALNLFDEICNSRWFKKTSMILMLNKRDLFAEKIESVPLTVWHPEYDGPNDFTHAAEYIQRQFEGKKKDLHKQIYVHFTCATDTNLMRQIFNAVKDIIIRKSLEESSLLS